jgi:hypothetical protein
MRGHVDYIATHVFEAEPTASADRRKSQPKLYSSECLIRDEAVLDRVVTLEFGGLRAVRLVLGESMRAHPRVSPSTNVGFNSPDLQTVRRTAGRFQTH